MSGEPIIGVVIMLVCTWGCGLLFYLIGHYGDKSTKPMHFWAGSEIDACRISDIPAYNHANAVMWKLYAVPYWLAGLLSCFGLHSEVFIIAGTVILIFAGFPGIPLLIRKYKQIAKKYVSSETGC